MALDLTAVTGALGALRALTSIAKDVNNIEFNQKIIEMQQKLLEIQIDYGNLLDENRALKDELEASKAYDFHHSVIWKKLSDGNETGPFCPICLAEKKMIMPLEYRGPYSANKEMNLFVCPIRHVPKGEGMNVSYLVPALLIPEERYTKRVL
jgi:hypothetical protein